MIDLMERGIEHIWREMWLHQKDDFSGEMIAESKPNVWRGMILCLKKQTNEYNSENFQMWR